MVEFQNKCFYTTKDITIGEIKGFSKEKKL